MNHTSLFSERLNSLNWYHSKIAATSAAIKSEAGILAHTPSTPKNVGKKYKQGNKNNNCRVRDKKMAFFANPILWKKLEVTI